MGYIELLYPPENHNLLVVSDLHLGADLKRNAVARLRSIARLEAEFSDFLAWYTQHREDDRPWHLIVNGDMMDFICVTATPRDGESVPFDLHEDDRRFGLEGTEAKIIWKLERIIERHGAVFRRLAAFLAAGNSMVVLRGNHDVELHWPGVQARFRELMADVAGDETVAERIRFEPWFYYEPGAIYVEHGNQFDEYSSFDYVLHPVEPAQPHVTEIPLSHYAIRYLANALRNVTVDDKDRWGFGDYLRFILSGQLGSVRSMASAYFRTVRHVFRGWVWRTRERFFSGHRREEHRRRREALAAAYGLERRTLLRLERLHHRPGTHNLHTALGLYYADRFAIYALAALLLITLMVAGTPSGLAVASTLAIVAGVALVTRWLARLRNTDISPKLERAGRRISDIMNVPLVVFGHSHRPSIQPLRQGGSWYVNVGTWLPQGPQSSGARLFTHFAVHRGRGWAELRRWCEERKIPVPLGPGGSRVRLPRR